MPLTPIDIQQKTFGPELRGYNMDEVDDFLDDVVVALKDYDQRLRDAEDRIRALEAELSTRGEDESAISRALVAAQKQADSLVADARVEAEKIRADAEGEADELRADRDAEKMSLTKDIARMRATVADMKRRIVELATAVSSDLDEMDVAAAEAASGIGSDLSDAANGNSDSGSAAPTYLSTASVGEGMDPFADEVDYETSDTAADSTPQHGRSGQHLSAVRDDDAAFSEDESDDETVGDLDEDTSYGNESVSVDADEDVEDDIELDDTDLDDTDLDDVEDDDDESGDEDSDDDAVVEEETPHVTERRPWERGSV